MREIIHSQERIASFSKSGDTHKYDYGHALLISGPATRTGATRLAARAALRVGAGLVTVGAGKGAMADFSSQSPAIMLKEIDSGEALIGFLEDEPRISSLCLGPGLGVDRRGAELIAAALGSGLPCVLDADAISLLAKIEPLADGLHENVVLTPHAGEFTRLFPGTDLETQEARRAAVMLAAEALSCTVLLKGTRTLVASPDGVIAELDGEKKTPAPWLATAGAGDVLSGLIAGLLARGIAPQEAAECGALLHLWAAHLYGPGLIASDLPDMVPQVFREWNLT